MFLVSDPEELQQQRQQEAMALALGKELVFKVRFLAVYFAALRVAPTVVSTIWKALE